MITTQEKENNFREALQREAGKVGSVFFEDVENGREIETRDMIGWDMFGFLIPMHLEGEFQKAWEKDDTEDWDDFLVSEKVSEVDGKIVISFNVIP